MNLIGKMAIGAATALAVGAAASAKTFINEISSDKEAKESRKDNVPLSYDKTRKQESASLRLQDAHRMAGRKATDTPRSGKRSLVAHSERSIPVADIERLSFESGRDGGADASDRTVAENGTFIILSGPSGVGKDTLLREVARMMEAEGVEVVRPKSYTTRDQRPGDPADAGYVFCDDAEFVSMLKNGHLMECTVSHGHLYGMSKTDFEDELAHGGDRIMMKVLDHHGAMFFRRRYPIATTTVFIRPPSFEALAARLEKRGDRAANEEDFKRRMLDSEAEMGLAGEYDYVVTSDDVKTASSILYAIVKAVSGVGQDKTEL